ncbi:hypothetical protein T439DRAFT_178265 [Meredithblackwellia eburnea MCA 4105]
MSSAGTVSVPKRRVFKACNPCRTKKARCDGVEPVCGVCSVLDVPCEFVPGRPRRGPKPGWKKRLQVRNDEEAESPHVESSVVPAKLSQTQRDSFAYYNDNRLQFRGLTSGLHVDPNPSQPSAAELGSEGALVALEEPEQDSEMRTPQSDTMPASRLLSRFFENFYASWPCVLPSTYSSTSIEDLERELDPTLSLALQAVGSVGLDAEVTAQLVEGAWQEVVEPTGVSTSLKSAQVLFLLAVAQHYAGNLSEAWTFSCLASSVAQEIGIHRKLPRLEQASLGPAVLERELRARVFWCIYNFDKFIAIDLGRTPAIRREDCNIPFPRLESASLEQWPLFTSKYPPWIPELRDRDMRTVATFQAITTTMQHVEDVVDLLYTLKAQDQLQKNPSALEKRADKLYGEIMDWSHTLEPWLQWREEDDGNRRPQVCMMQIGICMNTIMLHRPFPTLRHQQICITAALLMLTQVQSLLDYLPQEALFSELPYIIFTAASVLLNGMEREEGVEEIRNGIHQSINQLERMTASRSAYWMLSLVRKRFAPHHQRTTLEEERPPDPQ